MSYEKGMEYGRKIYLQNVEKYGFFEREHSEKVILTCREYYRNNKLRKTKSGKVLTNQRRLFYKGVADYLQAPHRNYGFVRDWK